MQPEIPEETHGPDIPKKASFFDKIKAIFHNKVSGPADPPQSHTPAPELDEETDRNTIPTDDSDDSGSDPTLGSGQAVTNEQSAPDADGTVTAPELNVPDSLTRNPGEETPTVPGAAGPGEDPNVPKISQVRSEQQGPPPQGQ